MDLGAEARGEALGSGAAHAVAELDPSRRRREVRRLAAQGVPRAAAEVSAASIARRLTSISQTLRAVEAPTPPAASARVPRAEARAAVTATAASPAGGAADLSEAIVGRVYGALRGQSAGDLAAALHLPREEVQSAALALAARGRIVRRGQRYFVP